MRPGLRRRRRREFGRQDQWTGRTKTQKNWKPGAAGAAEDWQMGNAGAEAATTAACGAAATGAKAAAEAESVTDATPSGQRPKPANWGEMSKNQKKT